MKFDEKKWRTLAANKPDELHSYIPQSSIIELFDEIERLEHEIAKCKEANDQKVHYLSALQFIASFVNAKDKTTVDDLIAIAGKEIDAEGDQIVDACNYWVSKLRDAEDKLQDAQLKPKTVYTVTMYRYGNREWHSYVLGAFSSNDIAREWAAKEEEYRGGKYKAEIIRWGIDSPTDFLKGEL